MKRLLMRSRRSGHWLLACFFLVLMAGCAVGPNYQRPALNTPNSYLPDGAPALESADQKYLAGDVPAQWWAAFHSPQVNALVKESLAHNPNLDAARAALLVASENVRVQQASFYPTVGASFAPSRQRSASVLASPLANNENIFNLYTAQLAVSYTPDVFGLNRRQVESLQADADNQRYQLEATYLSLTANAVNSAIQEAALRAQIDATSNIVAAQQRTLDTLRRARLLGQFADADVYQQEAALAQAKASLPVLDKQLALLRDSIAVLAGRYPDDPGFTAFSLSDIQLPEQLPETLPSSLVEHRPDILAAEESLHAASAAVGVAQASRLPSITLGVNNWGSTSESLAQLFASGTGFWTLAASITQPVFDGGALKHRQSAAEAAYQQAVAQYRATVLNAFQNVADALQAIAIDTVALKAAADAKTAASRSLAIGERQLALGDISPLALLVLQQTLQNAELNLVSAKSNRLQDSVALFQALGGGWWNRAPQAAGNSPHEHQLEQ
jgi:NodT family efflux transporter outer membrane factor (OMF) lipoprotein